MPTSHPVIARPRRKRWPLVLAAIAVALLLAVFAAYQIAARVLKSEVLQAIGPQSEIAGVRLGFGTVEISGLRLKAPAGWPTDTALKAATITIVPDLRELVSGEIYINRIIVEDGYVAAVRPPQGGGLQILPGVLASRKPRDAAASAGAPPARRTINIAVIALRHCVVDVFDRSLVGHSRMHVDDVEGTIRHVVAPQLVGHSTLDLAGAISHARHRGTLHVAGWIDVAGKASELKAVVRNVDLVPFSPYVADKAKAGIDAGTFNLDLTASVRHNVVNAHGVLVVDKLALHTGDGPMAAFDALPQRALLGALRNDKGSVEIEFDLKGSLDDPTFSLTGGLGLRAALAVLQAIGLGFEGLVRAFLMLFSGFAAALAPF